MRFDPFWRDIFQSGIDGGGRAFFFYMSQVLLAVPEKAKKKGVGECGWCPGFSLWALPTQVEIKYLKHARILPLAYPSLSSFELSAAFLCSFSPLLIFTSRPLFFFFFTTLSTTFRVRGSIDRGETSHSPTEDALHLAAISLSEIKLIFARPILPTHIYSIVVRFLLQQSESQKKVEPRASFFFYWD